MGTRVNMSLDDALERKLQCIKDQEGISKTTEQVRFCIARAFNSYPEEVRKKYV